MKLLCVHETNNNLYVHLKSFRETMSSKIEEVWCHALSMGGNGERRCQYVVSYCCNCNLGTKSRSLCHADREIVCSGCRVLPYKMFNMMYKIHTRYSGCSRPCCCSTLSRFVSELRYPVGQRVNMKLIDCFSKHFELCHILPFVLIEMDLT